jgi:hypothetical protein
VHNQNSRKFNDSAKLQIHVVPTIPNQISIFYSINQYFFLGQMDFVQSSKIAKLESCGRVQPIPDVCGASGLNIWGARDW